MIGHDAAVAMAGAEGNFELNVFRPLVIHEVLRSARLLGDAADSVRRHCIDGIVPNEARLRSYVEDSVMVITALTPVLGYDASAAVAKLAAEQDLSVREALDRLGHDPALMDGLVERALG